MNDPKNPLVGELAIDASDYQTKSLTSEQIKRTSKLRPSGLEEGLQNLFGQPEELLKRAGIDPSKIDEARDLYAQYKRAQQLLPAAEKLVDLLVESRIAYGHKLAVILAEAGSQAKRRARREPEGDEILAALREFLAYQYAPARKTLATKAKNKAK